MIVNAHVAGMVMGGTLVTLELTSIFMVTFFGNAMRKRVPRLAHHLGVGVKTTSYRFVAGLDTFLVSWFVTGNPWAASGIVGLEVITKFVLYYTHEWVWTFPALAKLVIKPVHVAA